MVPDDVVHNAHISPVVTQQPALLGPLRAPAVPSRAARPISSIVATPATAHPLAEVEARPGANWLLCFAVTADPKRHETLGGGGQILERATSDENDRGVRGV